MGSASVDKKRHYSSGMLANESTFNEIPIIFCKRSVASSRGRRPHPPTYGSSSNLFLITSSPFAPLAISRAVSGQRPEWKISVHIYPVLYVINVLEINHQTFGLAPLHLLSTVDLTMDFRCIHQLLQAMLHMPLMRDTIMDWLAPGYQN